MSKMIDETGQSYGRLLVIQRDTRNPSPQAYWSCICSCGNGTYVRGTHLRSGKVRSCGCLAIEERTKHGYAGSSEYRSYFNMLKRCYWDGDERYTDYGGRGIKVCDRWRESFENFIKDMREKPGSGFSIDRIDVNGDYAPENCRWADCYSQERNKRVRKDSPVGVRGVVRYRNKFRAQIYCHGKTHYLGCYDTVEEAATARKAAEDMYWRGGDAR